MARGRTGTLSTLSRRQPGHPFGSLMPYALDATGRPLFLISTLAMHTRNLDADPREPVRDRIERRRGPPCGWSCHADGHGKPRSAGRRRRRAGGLPRMASERRQLGGFRGLLVLAARAARRILGGRVRRHGLAPGP